MEKQEILARTAELLTARWIAPFDEHEFESFSEMSDEERRIYVFIDGKHLPNKIMYKLYKKEDNIVLARKEFRYKFMRNRFFIMSKYDTLFTITPKRVFMNDVGEASYVLRALYNFDSQTSIKNSTELRKFILKGELPESRHYSDARARIKSHFGPTELKVFTTNEDMIIDRMISSCGLESLIRDMIFQCKALNVKINSEWSDRRLQDQHQRWTKEMNKLRHRNCSTRPIWKFDFNLPDWVELINSEKRCAEEGDNMSHCLYSCYNKRILERSYIAFHTRTEDEEFTAGFYVDIRYQGIRFDQAYRKCNAPISEGSRALLEDIKVIAHRIINNHIQNTKRIEPYDCDGLVF